MTAAAATLVSLINTACAMVWDFPNQLTLRTQIVATEGAPGDAASQNPADGFSGMPFGKDLDELIALAPMRGPDRSLDHVAIVGLQDSRGWGVGVGSLGGLQLAGGYADRRGIQISVYYVKRLTPVSQDPMQDMGFGPPGDADGTVGVRIGWHF